MNVLWKRVILSIPGRKKKDLILEEKMVLQFRGVFGEAVENT